jgi:hypothetical protein
MRESPPESLAEIAFSVALPLRHPFKPDVTKVEMICFGAKT